MLFGLTDDDYELLAKELCTNKKYIIKQNITLEEYKKYYEPETDKK